MKQCKTWLYGCIGISICIVIASCNIKIDREKIAKSVSQGFMEGNVKPFTELVAAALAYYAQNSKWPKDATGLKQFALEHNMPASLEKFEYLSFLPKPNGNLEIDCRLGEYEVCSSNGKSGPAWTVLSATEKIELKPPEKQR